MRFVLIVLVVSMGLGGCASVTRGWSEQMQINSQPEGAEVRTSLNQQCVTPCTLTVQRKDEFSVSFAKPGYQPQTVQVTTRVAGGGAAGFAGNILVGGIIGMGVDAASGATLEHFPNPVSANLIPLKRGEKPRLDKIIPEPPAPKPEEAAPPRS